MLFFRKKRKSVSQVDWLIVGLGNPGVEYSGTRHNIGWMCAEKLCKKYNGHIESKNKLYLIATLRINSKMILVALPLTFMNKSGEAVVKICKHHDINSENIIIISDEYNFPLGKIQLKDGGGDGGHNGVASVIENINADNFLRLRCGIGKGFKSGGMSEYVLSDFEPEEVESRDLMINKSVDSLVYLITNGKARAMSDVNSGKLWNPAQALEQ